MAFFLVEDFRAGLDLRKANNTSPPGTLLEFENAHVSSGAEVEKAKAFDNTYDLPAGTFGLATLDNEIYVFGTGADPLTTEPDTMYVQLTTSSGSPLSTMLDYDVYDGLLYVVFELEDGTVDHFYDGTLVTSAAGKGRAVKTFQTKQYAVIDKTLNFSATGDATLWTSGTGFGFINLAQQDARGVNAVALEVYFSQLAVFSRRVIHLWATDVDPLNNALRQTLQQTGTIAPQSVTQFGNGDVLYLSDSGLRSLRARDSSNAAAVSDIGSPIDPLLLEDINTLGEATTALAKSIVEPVTGRFFLCLNDTIYVLSYFPGPNITAWSQYKPGITFDHVAIKGNQIVGRAGNKIYKLGGDDNATYDATQAKVTTPFMQIDNPATTKTFQGIDVACQGTWAVGVAYDPDNAIYETVATISNNTHRVQRIPLAGSATHISIRLTSTDTSRARIANIGVHYQSGETL